MEGKRLYVERESCKGESILCLLQRGADGEVMDGVSGKGMALKKRKKDKDLSLMVENVRK